MSDSPLILTLKLDDDSQGFFDALRERYFPAERNFIPAHVSLFNQLPGEREGLLPADIVEVCRGREPFPVRVEKLRSLGKGVAYVLNSDELSSVRGELSRAWEPFLGAQDSQKFSAHITVQNKVTPGRAKRLLADLEAGFSPFEVTGEGLVLWRYMGGPWELVEEFGFGDRGGPCGA